MIENSSAGLVMVAAEVTVTVTREDQHQPVLARYPVAAGLQRNVAVELGWCTIGSGKYRGQPAIEVRLDGDRVGELTHAMSQRYAPMLSQVAHHGGRPGCVAAVRRGTKGLEIVLHLPRHAANAVPVSRPGLPPTAVPPSAPPQRSVVSRRPWWIVAGVVAVLLIIGALADNDEEPSSSTLPAAGRAASTVAAAPTTTIPVTTATPTTALAPTTVAEPPPQPPPPQPPKASPKPAPPPATTAPKPRSQCDPNYSGCVPVASDVDCLGGSGNGPAYVAGPISVIGTDIYGLDNDKDGIACE